MTERARWIVLTPSADDAAWCREIERAARTAGYRVLRAGQDDPAVSGPSAETIMITDDAALALSAKAPEIVAIIAEPESSPEAVSATYHLQAPNNAWYASTLLARAAALADHHAVITATDLARRPPLLRLFDSLELIPPPSVAEVSTQPAVAAAFMVYRNPGLGSGSQPVRWSERLFVYDDKAARNWPDWGIMDVTGRPRMLVWGPNLSLPPGLWRAVVRFGVDDQAARHQFRIDWGTQTACVSEYVTPGRPGMYEIELDWQFEEADTAEIRLILTEGSFMGTVIFQGMTVQQIQRLADPAGSGRRPAA